MNYSTEQKAIFQWFASASGNLVVKARAGTGKTTTIKAAFEHAPESRILYAVFNKKNQREAAEKIQDSRVDVKTLHSLGFYFIKRVWRDAKPDDEVETDRCIQVSPHFANDKEGCAALLKLVGFAKNSFINPTEANLQAICEMQDIDCAEGIRVLCGWALKVLAASRIKDVQNRISFNDMVWLPVAMNWVKRIYDLVVIDETQDMNIPQLAMARGASKGRIACVGDDRQAIYAFRGAASDGMSTMKIQLRATELSLTTTYRCPKAVVKLAAEIVPDYHAAPTAPEGEVSTCGDVLNAAQIGDVILSRLNAPLMPLALQLLRKNIPARIEGRDIGRQLIGMVRTMKAKSVPHFIERVEAWLAKQIERLEKVKNADKKMEATRDIAETLKALAQDAKSVADIEARVNNLFQDSDSNSKPAVVLSSVHKAKGLEWPRVFLLADTFRRGKGMEEDNIFYVAVTRAMKALYIVGGAAPQPEAEALQVSVNDTCQPEKPMIPAPLPPKRKKVANEFDYALPAGMRLHKLGNIINFESRDWVCYRVSPSGANFSQLDNKRNRMTISAAHDSSLPILRTVSEAAAKNFVAKKPVGDESNQTNGNESDEIVMATKKSNKKSAVKGESSQVSYAGRGDAIMAMVKSGKSDTQILEAIKTKFPGSSKSPVLKTIAGKRKKLKAGDNKPAAKATTKPAAKGKPAPAPAPKAKSSAKKSAPAAPSAPAVPPPPAPPAPAAPAA